MCQLWALHAFIKRQFLHFILLRRRRAQCRPVVVAGAVVVAAAVVVVAATVVVSSSAVNTIATGCPIFVYVLYNLRYQIKRGTIFGHFYDNIYIHLYSPQTVAQQEKKNKESSSLTKSCTANNDND